jgi:hypothetical protein
LSEDILNYWFSEERRDHQGDTKDLVNKLIGQLELDGYVYRDSKLLSSEEDVVDVEEEKGVLKNLYESLNLNHKDVAFHHLDLSEEHYLEKRWDDTISNSRKFLECVLQEAAELINFRNKGSHLSKTIYESPSQIRAYLVQEGILEVKEKDAILKVYSLLSHTGGHPYMAENDQARLLRHLALTLSQFVLLRIQGAIK